MKIRLYRGFYKTGNSEGEFEYWSSHRNYSKANMEDLKREYFKRYGYYNYNNIEFSFGDIVDTIF